MTKTGNIRTAAVVAIRAPAVHGVSSISPFGEGETTLTKGEGN